jgi:predicted secreted protein
MRYPFQAGRGLLGLAAAAALVVLSAARADAQARTVTVSEAFDGGTMTMTAGDTLVVKLGGNAGSGYSWVPAFNDPAALQPVGSATGEPAPGGGGVRVFRFKAAATRGSDSLGFAWVRPSQTNESPGRIFRVLVAFGSSVNVKHQQVRESDGGSRVYLTEGDTLLVRLPATPANGFGWVVQRSSPVLKPVGESKWEPAPNGQGEGTQVLEFKVTEPGAAWLELGLRKTSEKDAKPTKTWAVFVAAAGLGAR